MHTGNTRVEDLDSGMMLIDTPASSSDIGSFKTTSTSPAVGSLVPAPQTSAMALVKTISQETALAFTRRTRPIRFPSSVSRYGIRHQKVAYALDPHPKGAEPKCQEYIVSEENVYEYASRLFGRGIRLNSRKPYGSILPSLIIFPVVPDFSFEWILLSYGSLCEIQQAIEIQKLHPYVQDQNGTGLFEVGVIA